MASRPAEDRAMRRILFYGASLGLALALGALVWFGAAAWGDRRDNRAIRDYAAGRNFDLREGASPVAVYARALHLTERDRSPEAEALTGSLDGLRKDLLSEHHRAVADARLRRGFEAIQTSNYDDAIPEVELAKSAYRRALRAWPENLDAKVNYDIAMRLLRDLPREGQDGEDDPENRPSRIWTDLPGLPRGAP